MMDAVEFLKTLRRMCNCECLKCEFKKRLSGPETCTVWRKNHPEEAVAIAEQWAKEHPVKTRQIEFLKQWPNAVTDNAGVISIAPCRLGEVNSSKCNDAGRCPDCRKAFWLAEVEG